MIEAEYEWPFQSHASMGPACAVVDVKQGRQATVWTGTQKPHFARDGVAQSPRAAARKGARDLGDGPGFLRPQRCGRYRHRRGVLSRAIGRPVRVQDMRDKGRLGSRRDRRVHRAPRGARCLGQGDRLRVRIARLLAGQRRHQRIAIRATASPGMRAAYAAEILRLDSACPPKSYGFDNKRLAWETDPAAARALLAVAHVAFARPGRAADPLRQQVSSSTSWRLRSTRIPSRSACATSRRRATSR